MSDRPLRPYQADAITALRQSLMTGHKRPVLQLPTGGGKTRVSGEIISSALAKGKRVAFVVPSLSLIDQTVESFYRDGMRDVGVIQADHVLTDWSKPVQVCSIQTIASRKAYPDVDLVLVDECHLMHKAQTAWISDPSWSKVPFIGLSATPWAKGMAKFYDDLIVSNTTAGMIAGGYLSPFRVFAPSKPDLSGVKVRMGDYVEADLEKAVDKPALIADIVETWLRLGENRPTLAFCVNRTHAKHVQERFEACGIPCGYVDAFTKAPERREIADMFRRGQYPVVASVGTLTTGVDWDVRCIIMARPTKSEILFTQIIGRGLRLADGKDHCTVLDHSDTHSRLGFVTDIHHTELDDGRQNRANKSEKKEPLPKECPKCTFLRPYRAKSCPNCGHVPEPQSGVLEASGRLVELGGKPQKKEAPKNHVRMGRSVIHNGEFFGMLKQYAIDRGFKGGWAANKYREATGAWPNYYRDVPLMRPVPDVVSWIISRNIAWAKRSVVTQGATVNAQ